jgi:LPS-assembly lipoprotein
MYAGGGSGAVAQGLAAVDVSPIEGKAGWLVRNALVDRLGAARNAGGNKGSAARYRLDVRLDDKLEGLALLSDDTVGRERRTLRARYQLVDLSNGNIVLDATDGSDAGIDVVSSEYAVIAAENTALENLSKDIADRIVTKVALQLRRAGPEAR